MRNYCGQSYCSIFSLASQFNSFSDFPDDPRQAESLLADLGITHVLSISPGEIPPSVLAAVLKSRSHYCHIEVRNNVKEDLLLALPGAVQFLEQAMLDGLVLVHSQMEVRACTVACACCALVQFPSQNISDTSPLQLISASNETGVSCTR